MATAMAAFFLALAVIPVASARTYLPMRDAPLVAKTYQRYLNGHGFRVRCSALGAYVVRCQGLTLTNDPRQPWHRWATGIRKVSRTTAERRIFMDGKSVGRPVLDPTFVRFFHISGWN